MKKKINPGKKALSVMLVLVLAAANVLSASAEEYPVYGQFLSGEYREDTPLPEEAYTVLGISSEDELVQLAADCQVDAWSRDKYIKLEKDIVLRQNRGVVIPSFGGIFDGGGHKITGLEITDAGSSMGLFRYVQEGGTVRNLSVLGRVHPEGTKSRIGILAGVNYGSIINCSVGGSVAAAEKAGGIAGVNEASGEIRRCHSAASVTGDHFTGGICGVNEGTLNNCTNSGSINTYSKEVSYDLEDITLENLEDMGGTENVSAHTDTGGIAGYSRGKIYYCSNSGKVGYQHVGYNTGGIVGRLHQGYLQNCTNTGYILGRKDVGGIAGQMEPFLEIQYMNDKLSEIDREAAVFFDLLEASHEELSGYGSQASELTKGISAHLSAASAAGGNLTGTANELWYIYNQELTGISSDLSRLNQELADQAAADRDKPKDEVTDGNQEDDTEDNTDNNILDVEKPSIDNGQSGESSRITVNGDWKPDKIPGNQVDIESYLAALRRFGEGTSTHLANITTATGDRSGGISSNLESLNRELAAAGDQLVQLADVLQQGTERTSANVDALMAQGKVLRRSISGLRDDLFRYEGITVEDASDEAPADEAGSPGADSGDAENASGEDSGTAEDTTEAYYDTSSFQQGKITLCINQGTVEADTNVGGIVGQVATEYDFDPEDDISISGAESFHIEQTLKAVIRESCNQGDITGKKDYVGGIVGKADYGAVVSCESYGKVASTDGSYVGGIAGFSGYCVRSSYTMGELSGKNYVGGIAGRGSDVFYSYACPELEFSGEYGGSIAGSLEEQGTLYGNYYVKGNVPGVDSVGHEGGATPLDYAEFCGREEVPDAFSHFTVIFQAEGQKLAEFQCEYGGSIDGTRIPEIPQKEGYYGLWPDFDFGHVTCSKVLEARYEKWITSLASAEKDPQGRALVLVQGQFLPEQRLVLEEGAEGTDFSIVTLDGEEVVAGEDTQPVRVRVPYGDGDPEDAVVEIRTEAGFRTVPTTVTGHYLEFSMDRPGTFRVTVLEREEYNGAMVLGAGAGACILLVILLMGKIRKRRKTKKENFS